jgi:hypothetical protein
MGLRCRCHRTNLPVTSTADRHGDRYLLPAQEAALTAAIHSAFDLDWALGTIRLP